MDSTNWIAYMDAAKGADTDAAVATKLGFAQSNITRWRSGASIPKPQQVVAFARAYGKSTLPALHAAGYINLADLTELGTEVQFSDLDDVPLRELVDELQRRLDSLTAALRDAEEFDRDALQALADLLRERPLPVADIEADTARTSDVRRPRDTTDAYALAASDDECWQQRQEEENE